MESSRNTLQALAAYILATGVPEKAIIPDRPIGKSKIDLAIVDPFTEETLAIFKIINDQAPAGETAAREQLRTCFYTLRNTHVISYLVYTVEGIPPFRVERIKFIQDD